MWKRSEVENRIRIAASIGLVHARSNGLKGMALPTREKILQILAFSFLASSESGLFFALKKFFFEILWNLQAFLIAQTVQHCQKILVLSFVYMRAVVFG